MKNRIAAFMNSLSRPFSLEIFPPKKEHQKAFEFVLRTIEVLCPTNPSFISVTYGAGGSNKGKVVQISHEVLERGILPLSHLTAVGFSKEDVRLVLDQLHEAGVRAILALRGDIPKGVTYPDGAWKDFHLAIDLIRLVREDGRFCVGAATYPEGHPTHRDPDRSVEHFAIKASAGADFFISQMFFDNSCFYRFVDTVRKRGLSHPIIPGIMPLVKKIQIQKILELSGAMIPKTLLESIERYQDDPESFCQAGIDFATQQVLMLRDQGIPNVHLYTMNQPDPILKILTQASLLDEKEIHNG